MLHRLRAGVLLGLGLVCGGSLFAQMTVTFKGTVNTVTDPTDYFHGSIHTGDPLSATFRAEDSTPWDPVYRGGDPLSIEWAGYWNFLPMDVTAGGYTLPVDPYSSVAISVVDSTYYDFVSCEFLLWHNDLPSYISLWTMQCDAMYGTIDAEGLIADPTISFSAKYLKYWTFHVSVVAPDPGDSHVFDVPVADVYGKIDSISTGSIGGSAVPEPSTFGICMIAAMVGMVCVRSVARRKHRR